MVIYVDKIQDADVSIAGWAAGPVVSRLSIEDIEGMLQVRPLVSSNGIMFIEVRVQQVCFNQGAWIKGKPRPATAHFSVRSRDAAKARKVLTMIYPSKPKKDYPRGVQW
jgi:hypothetical protein